ncbi:hypothetical protein ABTI15_20235, partial [Acinetobacter baumannii]
VTDRVEIPAWNTATVCHDILCEEAASRLVFFAVERFCPMFVDLVEHQTITVDVTSGFGRISISNSVSTGGVRKNERQNSAA